MDEQDEELNMDGTITMKQYFALNRKLNMIIKTVDDMQSKKTKSEEPFTKFADKSLLNFKDEKKSITEVKTCLASHGEELKTLATTVNKKINHMVSINNLENQLINISNSIISDENKMGNYEF